MGRKDIHRPSMANAADYTVLAIGEVERALNHDTGNDFSFLRLFELDPRWSELGSPEESTWAGHRENQCDHCGARIVYFSVLQHIPTGDILTVGLQCTERFLGGDWTLAKAKLKAKSTADRVLSSLPEDAAAAVRWADGDATAWYRTRDLAKLVLKGVSIAPWQWDKLTAAHKDHLRKASGDINSVPVGVQEISGVVVSVKTEPNTFAPRWADAEERTIRKVTIQDDRGFRVWGTLPTCAKNAKQGDRISLTATLKPSGKDPEFGTFSRPKDCTLGKLHELAGVA